MKKILRAKEEVLTRVTLSDAKSLNGRRIQYNEKMEGF